MKIEWLGHACFAITLPGGRTMITDPHRDIGYPPINRAAGIVTVSHGHFDHGAVDAVSGSPRVIREEGDHDLEGVRITGIPSFHDSQKGAKRGQNTIFVIEAGGLRACHLGDLGHIPDPGLIESMGRVDVLMVPVGGFYTIDSGQAVKVVDLIRPGYVLPMHYKTDCLNFPISGPGEFLAHYPGHLAVKELEVSAGSLPASSRAVLLELS